MSGRHLCRRNQRRLTMYSVDFVAFADVFCAPFSPFVASRVVYSDRCRPLDPAPQD